MIAQKTIDYATEVDALLGLIITLVKDIKQKKSVSEDLADLVQPFIQSVSGLKDLSVEVNDMPAVEKTVALRVVELFGALVD